MAPAAPCLVDALFDAFMLTSKLSWGEGLQSTVSAAPAAPTSYRPLAPRAYAAPSTASTPTPPRTISAGR